LPVDPLHPIHRLRLDEAAAIGKARAPKQQICEWPLFRLSGDMAYWRTLLALVALLAATMHAPAMATQQAPAAVAASSHCVDDAGEPSKPAKPDCCPEGCKGKCTTLGAFFAQPLQYAASFLRAALEAPVKAQPPKSLARAAERPPKA
jgi:hypothetical protein